MESFQLHYGTATAWLLLQVSDSKMSCRIFSKLCRKFLLICIIKPDIRHRLVGKERITDG